MLDRVQLEALKASIDEQLRSMEPVATPQPAPAYMSVSEYAERVGVCEQTVRRMIGEGLPHARPRPRVIRIRVTDADAWIDSRSAGSGRVGARKGSLQ